MQGDLPRGFRQTGSRRLLADFNTKAETIATRKASQNALEALVPALPELVGGSADLTGSNLTMVKASKTVSPGALSGSHIFYGVREFGMCAVMNGLALHGGVIPYGGTFLVFSDYARNALRLAALMGLRTIYVFSHDSIGLGEDGPTHQPIEHAATLRLIPNMDVWRPCDTVETAVGLGRGAAAQERPDRAPPDPAERAVPERESLKKHRQGRLCACRRPRRPRGHHRHRLRGRHRRRGAKAARRGRHRRCGWFPCRRRAFSTARTRNTGTPSCRRHSQR